MDVIGSSFPIPRDGGVAAMSDADLLNLRDRLAMQRRVLLDQLAADGAGGKGDADHLIEPAFLRLLADLHTTIAAVDAALAESVTAGDAP